MDSHIFKAYDIRGLYPQELNEEAAYKIGFAFQKYTKAKLIVVGEDGRRSSLTLREALIRGLTSAGAKVVSAGLTTTPLFYFAVASTKEAGAGIMITASHNPGKYNGFKLVWGDAMPIQPMEFIPLIQGDKKQIQNSKKVKITEIKVIDQYIKKLFSLVDVKKIRPMKIAIDAGNGMAGVTVNKLLARLPQIKARKLYFDIDMSFPHHEANPLKEETLETLKRAVLKEGAHLAVAYDGDADRIGFLDEKGNFVRADFIFAALLPQIFERCPKSAVLYDLRCSEIVPETIKKLGGRAKMTRVGHAFIKKDLRKNRAVAAAELSSHFYFKDFYGVECADLVLLYLLAAMSRQRKPLSQMIAPFKKYYQSGEINFEVIYKEKIIKKIEKKYSRQAKKISHLDGLRLDFEVLDGRSNRSHRDWWWFNIRASNTEPLLRLNMEASNEKLLKKKIKELTEIIKK